MLLLKIFFLSETKKTFDVEDNYNKINSFKCTMNKDIMKEFISFQPVSTQSHRQGI